MITITDAARKRIASLKERFPQPVKGLRIEATSRSLIRASFAMRFITQDEVIAPTDTRQCFDEIDVYFDAETAPYLEEASIDYLVSLMASGFKVTAPPRKLATPEAPLVEQVQKVLDGVINPSLACHGGGAMLVDLKGGTVYLELTGGCQGCSLAGSTMKDGIEAVIKAQVPEIQAVVDVTAHAHGRRPYFSRPEGRATAAVPA